jgi:hypothetical protein
MYNTIMLMLPKHSDVTEAFRLKTMRYPSGKTLTYDYDTIGNATAIKDGTQTLVSYEYSGGGSVMQTTYNQPGLTLDYTASGALDRFGRIFDHAWKKGSTDVVRIQHGYDRIGNRLYRNDTLHAANSEQYTYDGVSQIKSLKRTGYSESWNYDGTGNRLQYNRNGSVENRTHNKANEIQTNCTHDRNGNMAVIPGLKGTYDAWNRLVEVRDASDVLMATYGYNGLNQRVKKTVGTTVTTSFFNANWQELESKTGNDTTTYVWGLRYVDDLVLRERGKEKLYSLADPNWMWLQSPMLRVQSKNV